MSKVLRSLGLEFWLPLPLLGIALWVGGGFVMDGILSRSYKTTKYLQMEKKSAKPPVRVILAITAQINNRQGFTKVKVRLANATLKELEFQFPVTQLSQIEAAISQELGLPREEVRKLVRYQSSYSNPR